MVIGILLAHYLKPNFQVVFYGTMVLVFLLAFYWLIVRSKIHRSPIFGLLAFVCTIGLGVISYKLQDEKLRPQHYTHFNSTEDFHSIVFQIEKRLKPDTYNDKYIVAVKAFNDSTATGYLLVNIRKDSIDQPYNVDDVFFTSTALKTIPKPLNPHQFDYKKYLELNQVYHQLHLNSNNILLISNSTSTIYGYADQLRRQINLKLVEAGFKKDALSIMNALLLGQRQTIDKTIYNNYVNSGTIHILAISGLHVGILLFIFQFLLRPLLYLKFGNFIRPLLLVTILCGFAVIAGLSPSVTRAVAMFSVVSIAMHLKRPTNSYNTLVISAFLILLFKPSYLFEVGFQMSYLAVLGIVSVQPIIYKLWKLKYYLPNKLWQIFTVTLAAQVGVFPIALFYFHQFPGLFFISNIVVIPFLGLILGFGLLIIVLALLNALPDVMVIVYGFIIDSLNDFIGWVAQFESFLLRDIPFTFLQIITSYLFIITLIQVYKFRNFKWVISSLIALIIFQAVCFFNRYQNQYEAFVVFNKGRNSIIGKKQNDKLSLYHNMESDKIKSDLVLTNYKIGESINHITSEDLKSVYLFKDKTILAIDSLGIYKGLSFKPDYVILRNSPKLNLNRLIDSLKPKQIIADASSYKSYIRRWQLTCTQKKIPFHQTNEKGAFILK